ncbi:MAG: glycosyltransferase [Anaerolineae bacterium]|nr:glycosyltransferase [Anaerolineae bacterium]
MSHSSSRSFDVLFVPGREPDYIRNWMIRQALGRFSRLTVATDSVRPASWRYARALGKAALHLPLRPDFVLVGFYGQPLVPALRGLTRQPLILDAYVSTYDTLCFDRGRFRPRSAMGRLAYALDLWSCRWADHLLFDTQSHRDYFIQTFGLAPGKTSVVYVGCDEAHFAARPVSRSTDTFDVFTYGSFLRLHGVEHIMHAAKLLVGHDDIRITVAGDGVQLTEMKRLARDLGLSNVRFPGWIDFAELPARIARSDLCLGGHFSDVPKASRVIATKTFQFLAMGQPVVVGDSPANREVLVHGEHAYLCRMADPEALASAIVELREDRGFRSRLGEAGRALYQECFTVEATSRSIAGVLDNMAC